jgi:gas vesicle protein
MNSTGKVVAGVLAGAAVGAVFAMLFAPEKGTETRKKIVQKGTDWTDDLKETFDEFLASVSEKFETVKDSASDIAEKGKAKFESVKDNASDVAEKGRTKMEDVKKEVKTAINNNGNGHGKYNPYHS